MKFIQNEFGDIINANYVRCIFPDYDCKPIEVIAELDNGDRYVLAQFDAGDREGIKDYIDELYENLNTEDDGESYRSISRFG